MRMIDPRLDLIGVVVVGNVNDAFRLTIFARDRHPRFRQDWAKRQA